MPSVKAPDPASAAQSDTAAPSGDCNRRPDGSVRVVVNAESMMVRRLILSIDGGGIYGMSSAIWLRKIAELEPKFLAHGFIEKLILSGTSSGAVNALLLASHENPREALLSGELERFWQEPGVWSNDSPVSWLASNFGIAPYFGTDEFLAVLQRWFGDRTMGDLCRPVLISTYNWTGASDAERKFQTPMEVFKEAWEKRDLSPLRGPVDQGTRTTRAGQTGRFWKPKFYDNTHPDNGDLKVRLVDVAYAATAAPGFRAIRGGLGDGASFNANPSVNTIGFLVNRWQSELDLLSDAEVARMVAHVRGHDTDDTSPYPTGPAVVPEDFKREAAASLLMGHLLHGTTMVSLGSGQDLPHYAYANAGFGASLFQMIPTNPFTKVWLSPSYFSLDAATTDAEFIARQLLTDKHFIRLNPDILSIPTLMAAYLARNPLTRQMLTNTIYQACESPPSINAVENTVRFLRMSLWGLSKAKAREGLAHL